MKFREILPRILLGASLAILPQPAMGSDKQPKYEQLLKRSSDIETERQEVLLNKGTMEDTTRSW